MYRMRINITRTAMRGFQEGDTESVSFKHFEGLPAQGYPADVSFLRRRGFASCPTTARRGR